MSLGERVGMLGFNKASMNSMRDVLDMGEVIRTTRRPIVIMMSTLNNVASGLVGASRLTISKSLSCRGRFSRVTLHRCRVVRDIVPTNRGGVHLRRAIRTLLSRLGDVCRNICLVHSLSPGASTTVIDCNRHLSSGVMTALVSGTQ